MNIRFEEKLTDLPEVPKAFGDDGGHFYRYYDALADEIDDDMVASLKAQLDGILIYAGLFAGVNSAFLALTLPEMSADPADDTNALLLQLVTGGNHNITSMDDLPSASFSPASGIFSINVLFSISLTLALLAAFLAVIGQQWLVYYRKHSGGGADAQRWEQLRRYLGAKRWRLEAILDDILPTLLQLGLIIFCIAFALYLYTLSRWVCYAVAIPMALALACILFMAISAALDQWCPFKSPLSRALQLVPPSVARPAWHRILSCLSWLLTGGVKAKRIIGGAAGPMTQWVGNAAAHLRRLAGGILSLAKYLSGALIKFIIRPGFGETQGSRGSYASNLVSRVAKQIPRAAEPVLQLNAIAVKRILCTSEDPNALIYAATNLQALGSPECSELLLSNEEVYDRLWEGVRRCYGDFADGYGRTTSSLQALHSQAMRSAFIHLVFSSGRTDFLFGHCRGLQPFPPVPTDSLKVDKAVHDLQHRVKVINMPALRPIAANHPSTTQLGLLLIQFILNPLEVLSSKFDRWLEDHARLAEVEAEARKPGLFVPFLAYLLACSVQIFTNIKRHSLYSGLVGELRPTFLSMNKEYTEWGLRTVCDIVLMYRKCNVRDTLELIKEVFPTLHLDPSNRPSNSVYISLLQCGHMCRTEPGLAKWDWQRFFVATAIDLSSSSLRRTQHSILSQHETDQLRDDLAHCLKSLDDYIGDTSARYHFASYYEEKIPEKYTKFLKLASDALQREIDVSGEAVWGRAIQLGEVLVCIGRRIRTESAAEEYRDVDQDMESALNDARLLKPSNLLTLSQNPADPPTVQAVQDKVKTSGPGA